MSPSRSHLVLCRKQLRTNRHKRETDKQKCVSVFVVESSYLRCCCSITNTEISLVTNKLH